MLVPLLAEEKKAQRRERKNFHRPNPLAASKLLISFLIFQISTFLSDDSCGCSAIEIELGEFRKEKRENISQDTAEKGKRGMFRVLDVIRQSEM